MKLSKILLVLFKKGVRLFSGYGVSKFYPVKNIYKFLKRELKNSKGIVEVQGHKMLLDSKDSLELSIRGVHEPLETKLVKKEIKEGNVVLNIGAHIGYYTLIFAKLVGEKGEVFAFEPEPTNFSLLQKNVEINGYKNVVLVQKVVSNKSGKAKLYLCKDHTGMHRIEYSNGDRKFIEIETIRLDDYFKDYNGKIDFIKMDIEGAEGGALEGMPLLLEKNKKMKIITEFFPSALKEFGVEPEEFLKLLTKYGFKFFAINEKEKKIKPINISELLKIYTPEKGNATDLLCLREK